jgi:hypothetical protein
MKIPNHIIRKNCTNTHTHTHRERETERARERERRRRRQHSESVAIYKPGREASSETNPDDTMILDFWPPEL